MGKEQGGICYEKVTDPSLLFSLSFPAVCEVLFIYRFVLCFGDPRLWWGMGSYLPMLGNIGVPLFDEKKFFLFLLLLL